MSLMEQFSNPGAFESLGFGEKMAASTVTMIIGMGITFLILILLWVFIVIMGKALGSTSKKEAAPAAPAAPAAAKGEIVEGDDALIAVLVAAIAAYEGDSGLVSRLVVKRVVRVPGPQTPWGAAGMAERMDSRRF